MLQTDELFAAAATANDNVRIELTQFFSLSFTTLK